MNPVGFLRSLWPATVLFVAIVLVAGSLAAEMAGPPRVQPPGVRTVQAPGLHNAFALGTNIFSGSSPETEESFATLARLGIKTIITVDGAKPDVATARKWGLRYVHLLHGYDGISTNLQLQLAKAAQTLPGPIYVHCHHGRHRGPAAAAIICMTHAGWTPAQAEAWLSMAGTATNYAGLYEVVRTFRAPSQDEINKAEASFPETATASGLVEAMVDMDKRWEHLQAARRADYNPPADHPDLHPANEAVILWEHYREAQRRPEAQRRGPEFIERLARAEQEAREAERLLRRFAAKPRPEIRAQLDKTFETIGRTCNSCHHAFRDRTNDRSVLSN